MRTALRTGQGFFEVRTAKADPVIPAGVARITMIHFEQIDIEVLPDAPAEDLGTQFTILAAMEAESPEVRRMLYALRDDEAHAPRDEKGEQQ